MRRSTLSRLIRTFVLAACVASGDSVARAQELVMVETRGCPWCAAWNREVGPIYPLTLEGKRFPLRRVDLADVRKAMPELAKPVTVAPTFLVLACGRESGRIVGYPGEDFFWGLLAEAARVAASC